MQTTGQTDSRRLYDWIVATGLEFGRAISKEHLTEALGKSIDQNRTALYRANRLLEEEKKRTLICVPRKGYRIADPSEVRDIAALRVKRSRKQVRNGIHTVANTDTAAMSQEEKQELDLLRSGLDAVQKDLSRVYRRLSRTEARVMELEEQPRLSEDEVAFVRSLMQKAA